MYYRGNDNKPIRKDKPMRRRCLSAKSKRRIKSFVGEEPRDLEEDLLREDQYSFLKAELGQPTPCGKRQDPIPIVLKRESNSLCEGARPKKITQIKPSLQPYYPNWTFIFLEFFLIFVVLGLCTLISLLINITLTEAFVILGVFASAFTIYTSIITICQFHKKYPRQ